MENLIQGRLDDWVALINQRPTKYLGYQTSVFTGHIPQV